MDKEINKAEDSLADALTVRGEEATAFLLKSIAQSLITANKIALSEGENHE